jgi:hypothetical protein
LTHKSGLVPTLIRNLDIGSKFKNTSAVKFMAHAARGVKNTLVSAGSAALNPQNTARALGKGIKNLATDPSSIFKPAINGIKNTCDGKDKSSCLGDIIGGGFGISAGLSALETSSQKIAEQRGDKDTDFQHFAKGKSPSNLTQASST